MGNNQEEARIVQDAGNGIHFVSKVPSSGMEIDTIGVHDGENLLPNGRIPRPYQDEPDPVRQPLKMKKAERTVDARKPLREQHRVVPRGVVFGGTPTHGVKHLPQR